MDKIDILRKVLITAKGENMKSVYCKHCGTFLFGIENSCVYYVTKCKKCGKVNYGNTNKVFKPNKKNKK